MTLHWLFLYVPTLRPRCCQQYNGNGLRLSQQEKIRFRGTAIVARRLVSRYLGIEILGECKILSADETAMDIRDSGRNLIRFVPKR
jgi:hypothetical protein